VEAERMTKEVRCNECGRKGENTVWIPESGARGKVCPNCEEGRKINAAHPKKGKAQQKEVRSVEIKEKVKRKWHWREEKAARGGYLVERKERGWIERRGERWCAVSLVTCGYCGENGEDEGDNFVKLDSVHDMWCQGCERYKDRLDREVRQGRKFKNKCDICA